MASREFRRGAGSAIKVLAIVALALVCVGYSRLGGNPEPGGPADSGEEESQPQDGRGESTDGGGSADGETSGPQGPATGDAQQDGGTGTTTSGSDGCEQLADAGSGEDGSVGDTGCEYARAEGEVSGTVALEGQHTYSRSGGRHDLSVDQAMTVDVDRLGALVDRWADDVGVGGSVSILGTSQVASGQQYELCGVLSDGSRGVFGVVVLGDDGTSRTYPDVSPTIAGMVLDSEDVAAYMSGGGSPKADEQDTQQV